MPAPKNPWTARQTIICSIVEANPHRKLAMVKPEAEIANSNLVPSARDRNPDSGIAITSAIRYEVWTHDTSLELDIQAGLSASSSEVSWVQTSYLIAEVIAIPLSGFLSRALGTRLLFATSAAGFTIASFACGFASSIEQMILWRAIQGFLGAGMIPTVFASAYTVFPRSKFHIVGPIIGPGSTLVSTIGPTVGRFIT